LEESEDFRRSARLFEQSSKAHQQIADSGFEKWLYAPAEGATETQETEEQALEAQWADDDMMLRLKIAGGVSVAAAFLGMPIVTLFSTSLAVQIPFIWGFMNIPLLTLAVITWRRRELRLGVKRPVRGRKARILVVMLVLFSFLSFAMAVANIAIGP